MDKKKVLKTTIGILLSGFTLLSYNPSILTASSMESVKLDLNGAKTVDENGKDCINFSWTDLNKNVENREKYEYSLFLKKSADEKEYELQTSPIKGTVRVLNIYPNIGNSLKDWMNDLALTPVSESNDAEYIETFKDGRQNRYKYDRDKDGNYLTNGYGTVNVEEGIDIYGNKKLIAKRDSNGNINYITKPLITVDEIPLEDYTDENGNIKKGFNSDQSILFDENNQYKYDVIYDGAYDKNNGEFLHRINPDIPGSPEAICNFIDTGRGFLFGHDNAAKSHPEEKEICERMKIKPDSTKNYYASNKVKISKTGLLTRYPWNIEDVDISTHKFNIPLAHDWYQVTEGDVWFEFSDGTFNIVNTDAEGQKSNFYLTTYNNTAMIQTGHSNGAAIPDEEKILANTLFYLSQITSNNNYIDYSCIDNDAPKKPEIKDIKVDEETTIDFNKAEDVESKYEYTVKAKKVGAKDFICSSNALSFDATSGVKGYLIYCDNNENTKIDDLLGKSFNIYRDFNKLKNSGIEFIDDDEFNGSYTLKDRLQDNSYIHVAAIDKASNISDTSTKQYQYLNILNIEQEQYNDNNNSIWTDITLNNINDDNTAFSIRNIKDILNQHITIKYDKSKLKYNGVCTFDRSFIILDQNDNDGELTFDLISGNIENYINGQAKMLALNFQPIGSGNTQIIITNTSMNNGAVTVLPVQLGKCIISIS